ncbi:hypothetical protein FLA_2851 [Filimonas lacunae]|nr:hypothetical protein FLA_2851 [Filimonas lacunae]
MLQTIKSSGNKKAGDGSKTPLPSLASNYLFFIINTFIVYSAAVSLV